MDDGQCTLGIYVLGLLVITPSMLKDAIRKFRGWRPKPSSSNWAHSLHLVNLLNSLSGRPPQSEPYELQWHVLAQLEIGAVVVLWAGAALVLILILRA